MEGVPQPGLHADQGCIEDAGDLRRTQSVRSARGRGGRHRLLRDRPRSLAAALILAWHGTQRARVALRTLSPGGLILSLAFALSGCSSVSRGSLEAVRLAVQGEKVEPTAASVAAVPYFQLQANAPGGEAILILAHAEHGELGWYGVSHDIVFTRDGLLVKTVGLPQNLDDSAIPAPDPFQTGLQRLGAPLEYTRRMDWSPGYRYGVLLHAHLQPGAMEDVEILGTVHHLRRFDERISAPGIHMTNRYWVDPADGFI